MKKILILLTQMMVVSSFSFVVSGCFDPLAGDRGDHDENKPPEPPPPNKDIEYYQELIKKIEVYVNNCEEWIKQIEKDWKSGSLNEVEYQLLLDTVSIRLYDYQSEINEYQYQILLLEKKGNKFNPDQVLKGLKIISEKIDNLNEVLQLKTKYPDQYPQSEVEKLKDTIKETKEIEEMFLKLKEEEEDKCGNLF